LENTLHNWKTVIRARPTATGSLLAPNRAQGPPGRSLSARAPTRDTARRPDSDQERSDRGYCSDRPTASTCRPCHPPAPYPLRESLAKRRYFRHLARRPAPACPSPLSRAPLKTAAGSCPKPPTSCAVVAPERARPRACSAAAKTVSEASRRRPLLPP
jgi:hypothetical protein